jgi:hypothetical protein
MDKSAEMAERHGRILSELAELALSLARDLHRRATTADTPEAVADLGLAFHRIARSVRQTVALEAKLERDRDRATREDRVETTRRAQAVAGLRKAQVRAAVARAIWTEAEGDEAENLLDDLDDRLDSEIVADDLTEAAVEIHIARLCAQLGVTPPRAVASDLPAAEGADGGVPATRSVHRQSSD